MSDYSTIVLFADISGSVQLYESLGDQAAKNLVVKLQQRLANIVTDCSGVVQEIVGDEIMCRFEHAADAIGCAAKIHQCTASFGSDPTSALPDQVQMRIGIHGGSAILDGDRLFGDTVNTASRIMSIALAGQTITTEAVLQQLPLAMQSTARKFDEITLKGKSRPTVIYDYPWQAQDLTQIKQIPIEKTPSTLQLTYDGKTFQINVEDCPTTIGRAINNQVVVDSEPVSRRHVAIEYLRGRFVLSDRSTNGTHVYPAIGEAIYLRREQIPLWGKGRFCLGAPDGEAENHDVEYSCETVNGRTPMTAET